MFVNGTQLQNSKNIFSLHKDHKMSTIEFNHTQYLLL